MDTPADVKNSDLLLQLSPEAILKVNPDTGLLPVCVVAE